MDLLLAIFDSKMPEGVPSDCVGYGLCMVLSPSMPLLDLGFVSEHKGTLGIGAEM